MHNKIEQDSSVNKKLPWTGERLIPDEAGEHLEIEHRVRYSFAQRFVRAQRVLEVGSGEGYGSNYLAEFAEKVDSIDISQEAVEHAKGKYKRSNLNFHCTSAEKLPFADEVFDVVVSFEVIEHLPEQDSYLQEILRVLKPGGQFIVSTPNKHFYGPNGSKNPFHTREFTPDEFESLLSRFFSGIDLYGQIDWWDLKPEFGSEPTVIQKLGLVANAPSFFLKRAISRLIPTMAVDLAGKSYEVKRSSNFLIKGRFDFAGYYVAVCTKNSAI